MGFRVLRARLSTQRREGGGGGGGGALLVNTAMRKDTHSENATVHCHLRKIRFRDNLHNTRTEGNLDLCERPT